MLSLGARELSSVNESDESCPLFSSSSSKLEIKKLDDDNISFNLGYVKSLGYVKKNGQMLKTSIWDNVKRSTVTIRFYFIN